MPYLLLINEPIGQRATRTPTEGHEAYASMLRFAEDLKRRSLLLAMDSLSSQDDAARVSLRNGKPQVLDGPFAEAKEMIGGFFLVNCSTRAEAVAIAIECPAAQWCTIEVRSSGPCYD